MKKSTKKSVKKVAKMKTSPSQKAQKPVTDNDISSEAIEAAIRQGAEKLMQDGVSEKDAWKIARQVFADIHVLQRMVLKCPHFNHMLDLLEITDGMHVLDQMHHLRVRSSTDCTYTISTMHDLMFRVYMFGFFHGHLFARADDNLDAGFEHDFLQVSKEKAEFIVNTITRAYDMLLPDAIENHVSSVSIESVHTAMDVPKYKNTSVNDF